MIVQKETRCVLQVSQDSGVEGQGGSLKEVLYGEAWPEVQFLNSLPFTPSKSHTMLLFIYL